MTTTVTQPTKTIDGFQVRIGDALSIKDNSRFDNFGTKKFRVIDSDDRSFAVEKNGHCWWWYRESLRPYTGDAVIL